MPDFNEKLLQFIWQHRLLKTQPLYTRSGKEVVILKTGDLNADAGPDFFNGQIRLSDVVLAGNIELHMKTSDWLKHRHQHDKNYDKLILHAVYEHDMDLPQNLRNQVEILELKDLVAEKTISLYAQLVTTANKLPCSGQLKEVNDLKFMSWFERMTIERLEDKVGRLGLLFEQFNNDYTQTFYAVLLRSFGFKVNALPFELLSRHLPVHILLKHADNLFQLEALLLGTSGFLEDQFEDKYLQQLQNEFAFFKNKYQLAPLQKELFKFARLRPANFPSLRLAQFAALLHAHKDFIANPYSFDNYTDLKKILNVKPEGYWKNHYTLGGRALKKDLSFGEASAESIIINTIAPFFFFYSKKLSKPHFSELAVDLLQQAGFEKNHKTKLFESRKNLLKSAADSQAIINLYDNYCSKKQCLKCGIGASILKTG